MYWVPERLRGTLQWLSDIRAKAEKGCYGASSEVRRSRGGAAGVVAFLHIWLCMSSATAVLHAAAAPAAVTMEPASHAPITWELRETAGVEVTLGSRTWRFQGPAGQVVPDSTGSLDCNVRVPGNGHGELPDNVYLPQNVDDAARSAGWSFVDLVMTFNGHDCAGKAASAPAVLRIELPQTQVDVVLLHGLGSTGQAMGNLETEIRERLRHFWYTIRPWVWDLPPTADLAQWAVNIQARIAHELPADARKLIIIGHSMGGKAAIHAAWGDRALSGRTAMIITINTPYDALALYQGALEQLCETYFFARPGQSDQGACESLAYDSVAIEVAPLVGRGLTIVSLRSARGALRDPVCLGVDIYPEYPDDGLVPIEAQTAPGAVRLDYGEWCHFDYADRAAGLIAALIVPMIVQTLSGS